MADTRARLMQRPDIRLDRETWDGRLAVETITRRGIEAFAPYGKFYMWSLGYCSGWSGNASGELPKPQHDRCLREFLASEGLIVEGETP